MASGASVKLGVEGISQFKTNMNQAKQAVKTLDAQLTLTEKQFKQTGDAESYMTEKAELLKAKLEKQKEIVANAEKALEDMKDRGIDPASKAYQDMYRQMINAKGEMLDTENAMNGIATAGEDAANGVSEMDQQLSRIGQGINYEQVTTSLNKISEGMEKAMKKAIDLGKTIVKDVLGAGSWADDLNTRATYYGLTPEQLQQMEKTAQLIDTPVDAIINAKKRLKKEMAGRSEETMGAFAALGIDPDSAKDAEDLFWKTGEALMKMGDEYDKEAYAQKLFGRSWNELIPLFEAGRKQYDELNESWSVVPQASLDALQEMDDQDQTMQAELDTVKKQLEATLAPAVTQVMGMLTNLMTEFNKFLQTEKGQEMLQALSDAVTSLFSDIANIDPEDVMNTLTGALNGITEAFRWIEEHRSAVVGAVEAFIGTWALVKTASGITTVMNLINGIKGLTASGAAAAGASVGASWAGAFVSAAMKAAPFLAFLYEMLNPAGSATNDLDQLYDENGELTTAGREAMERNGESLIYDPNDPKYAVSPNHTTIDLTPRGWGSDQEKKYEPVELTGGEGITDWTTRQRNSARAWEEMKNAADKMEQTADDLSGNSEASRKSSSDMSAAAGTLKGMPGQVEEAILRGMASVKIYIDGQQAGNVLTPYVNQSLAGFLAGFTK